MTSQGVSMPRFRPSSRAGKGASVAAAISTAGILAAAACSPATTKATSSAPNLDSIQHVVVVSLENWSFDSLYGNFPGADGLSGASRVTQVDNNGVPYPTLPQPLNSNNEAKPASGAAPPPAP